MARISIATALTAMALPAFAGSIETPKNAAIDANFDIVKASVTLAGGQLSFAIEVSGTAGGTRPAATGAMLGSSVFAYVWPTSLDSSAVGFGPGEGILALAVTAHPDFDDTPKYDEDGDGNAANDGKDWHAHWVVLAKDETCAGGLRVKDVAPGIEAKMPATAPGLPLLLDSPDVRPQAAGSVITLTVPMPDGGADLKFDGVTTGLRVNSEMKAPLLCVADVFKIASGDLSLPGTVDAK